MLGRHDLKYHVRNEVQAVTNQRRHSLPSYCMQHPDATDGLKATGRTQITEGGSTLRTVKVHRFTGSLKTTDITPQETRLGGRYLSKM
jgi:hypothetical protein